MKNIVLLFVALFTTCACINRVQDSIFLDNVDIITKSSETVLYQVTEKDLQSYVHYLSVHDGFKDNKVQSISSYIKDGHTVFYILNLNRGWRIISADKRGPVVLAKSNYGHFDIDSVCEEELSWFESLAGQILFRNEHPDVYYSSRTKKDLINENKSFDFWRAINGDKSLLEERLSLSKNKNRSDSLVLTLVQSNVVGYESVDHLIPVYWDQLSPFNRYCPLISQSDTIRCPAGCGPIAVAQVAYYIHHYMYGINYIPTTGSCIGWYQNYSQSFSNYDSFSWDQMSYSDDPNGYAAVFIGYLGKYMPVNYSPSGSGTTFSQMSSVLSTTLGLHYLSKNFDLDVVYSDLNAGRPVICSGYNVLSEKSHVFILDGYETCIEESLYEYTDSSGIVRDTLILSQPMLTDLRINWGRGSQGRNSVYAATGSWDGYDYNRKIVYDIMPENK